MEKPIISLVASANRYEFWPRFFDTLRYHQTPLEVIFVGDRKPPFPLPPFARHIYATVKPAQCYQIAFWEAQGELIHWTADDADYCPKSKYGDCLNPLDIAYKHWLKMEDKYNNDKKSIVALRPIENGGDVWNFHYYFGGCTWSPRMAPFALVHRKYLSEAGTGYDNRFVSGQSENDVIMRVYEDGGRVEVCMEAMLYVHHQQVHPRNPETGKEDNKFRKWYNKDREILENCWVREGYGRYEKYSPEQLKSVVHISPTRLLPLEPFIKTEDVYTKTQGEKGHWL
jgi:hypothetical protein